MGERVFAYTGVGAGGGYGELTVVPEAFLARVPNRLDWAEAGTVPGVGASAYEAFTVHAPLQPRMKVFINGAAGGVGTYAVQVAKALGAEVTGTCSAAKETLVRELGADHVVDYAASDPFADAGVGYDAILNAVRGAPLARLRRLLNPGGVLVTLTGVPLQAPIGQLRNQVSSRRTVVMFVGTSGEILQGLARMIEAGVVRPVVEQVYSWDEIAEAHRRVETGRVYGKVAVVPS